MTQLRTIAAGLLLCLVAIVPQISSAQGGPPPDSPRAKAIRALQGLLTSSDADLAAVVEASIAPVLKDSLGDGLMEWVGQLRSTFTGGAFQGFAPAGPTSVAGSYEVASGVLDVTFTVETEEPFRLTEIIWELPSGAAQEE